MGLKPKLTHRGLAQRVGIVLVVIAMTAIAAGIVGRMLAQHGQVWLVGSIAAAVPKELHVSFLTALWSHSASYLVGTLGGVGLCIDVLRQRSRLARAASTHPADDATTVEGWFRQTTQRKKHKSRRLSGHDPSHAPCAASR
jgi:hypothetical protein